MEVPAEQNTFVNQEIQELVAGNCFVVCAGVADGSSVRKFVLPEQIHGTHDLGKYALSTAGIGCVVQTFYRHGKNNIFALFHVIAELLVYQCSVGKDHKAAVLMFFGQRDNVLFADQRFASGQYVAVCPKFFTLGNNFVHIFIREIQGAAVFRSPAAGAVQIACAGRIKQDNPRNINAIFLDIFLCLMIADVACLKAEGKKQSLDNLRVYIPQDTVEEIRPFHAGLKILSQVFKSLRTPGVSQKLGCHINDLQIAVFLVGRLDDLIERNFKGFSLCGMYDFIRHSATPPHMSIQTYHPSDPSSG